RNLTIGGDERLRLVVLDDERQSSAPSGANENASRAANRDDLPQFAQAWRGLSRRDVQQRRSAAAVYATISPQPTHPGSIIMHTPEKSERIEIQDATEELDPLRLFSSVH